VRIDPASRAEALAAYEELFASMHDGSMWRYFRSGKKSRTAKG
jgi:hypothetical protein